MQQLFEYDVEVQQAIIERKPILAFESTVITHGLPFPENIELIQAISEIAAEHSVTIAIIGILNGKIKIGLNLNEISYLLEDKKILKAGKRDIPYVLSAGLSAGTTVSATLFCADMAGIKVFATGGIGGVHRGENLDISADLYEIAKTPIAVICSGAKAILDLPKTLEVLETFSVPIIGYQTKMLPAFYTAKTNYSLPASVDDIQNLVSVLTIHWQLGMRSGVLIANPIPAQYEIPSATIEPAIIHALRQAQEKQITGKDLTPFLLSELAHVTNGESLKANLSLIKNNVRLGAMLANALMMEKLVNEHSTTST